MALCHIALGGNVGSVGETFSRALQLLAKSDVIVRQVSRLYRTAAVGERAGEPFLNAAAALETDLEPVALLDRLQVVEASLGRTHNVRWGPRPIDLDLLLWGERVVEDPRLWVPHPAAWYRRFVLDPLAEIAGDVVHPVKGLTIHELRARLLPRPLNVALAGGETDDRVELLSRLRVEFPLASIREWNSGARAEMLPGQEPALICWLGDVQTQQFGRRGFEELPAVPRLDASAANSTRTEAIAFLRGVLQSALDEPIVCD